VLDLTFVVFEFLFLKERPDISIDIRSRVERKEKQPESLFFLVDKRQKSDASNWIIT